MVNYYKSLVELFHIYLQIFWKPDFIKSISINEFIDHKIQLGILRSLSIEKIFWGTNLDFGHPDKRKKLALAKYIRIIF